MKVAVVGATGLVGGKMLEVLHERKFPVSELIPVASETSAGKKITFQNKEFEVITPENALTRKIDLALFSAGGGTSVKWAPLFAEKGIRVIDNSSAWRMDPNKKLVVPEVNADVLEKSDLIIANPNCSTIQMVVALYPLHQSFKIKRIVVSTYQSVTGTGKKAVDQLLNERSGIPTINPAYAHQIDLNLIPQIDIFMENGYTKEEMKMINETRKIMRDDSLEITATTVRVPVMGGHSESINVEFEREFELENIRQILENSSGVTVLDNPEDASYPMPIFAQNKDDVFVGRIRRDFSRSNAINLWCVSDNLRKGAATNAIQIAEVLVNKGFIA